MAPPSSFVTGKRRLDQLLRSNATQAVLPISLVVAITGVMMFFHWRKESVQGMHEWLGLGLVAALVLHLMRNRHQLAHTLKQRRLRLFVVTTVLIVIGFLSLQTTNANPGRLAVQALSHAPLKSLPQVLNRSASDLENQLKALGITPVDDKDNLGDLAAQVHQPASWLITQLLKP